MIKDILLPDLGEGITLVEISEVLVNPGDSIQTDDTIIVLESEKATMEIPSEESGSVKEVLIKSGDKIKPGTVLMKLEVKESKLKKTATSEPILVREPDPPQEKSVPDQLISPGTVLNESEESKPVSEKLPLASPSVRLFARELGANLAHITGTGAKGRITKHDVQSYIKSVLNAPDAAVPMIPATPKIDFSLWGEIKKVKLSKIKMITGQRLQQAWQSIPHVTQFDEADITDLDAFRKSLKSLNNNENLKITLLPFIMKAIVQSLQKFPEFNSSLDHTGHNLIYKYYYHIGVAVDTENGLVVPVIRDVNKRNFRDLSEELVDVSIKAREKKLLPEAMKGGTFTISNLGGISGTGFTPIVNTPEVAILGLSRSKLIPKFVKGSIEPRLILPFSLSYDHRVIDGAEAARFTKYLGELLQDFSKINNLEFT
ncbi:MAG: 2-oxo acid dehydrogenase subunit E2 [Fidelibacterota bacterium]